MDSTAQQPSQLSQHPIYSRVLFLIIVFLAVAVVAVAIVSFLLIKSRGKISGPVSESPEVVDYPLVPGFYKAQNLMNAYKDIVIKSVAQQVYSGKLISFDPDKSFAVEKKGKTAIIANGSGGKIEYFRLAESDAKSRLPISSDDLKVGDMVNITTEIDAKTGQNTVKSVTKLTSKVSISATQPASPGK